MTTHRQYTVRLREAAEHRGYVDAVGLSYSLGCCESILSYLAAISPENKAIIEEKVAYIERISQN